MTLLSTCRTNIETRNVWNWRQLCDLRLYWHCEGSLLPWNVVVSNKSRRSNRDHHGFLRSWKYLEVFLSISICATTILWTLDRHAPHRACSRRIPMPSPYAYECVKSLVTRWMMKPYATIKPVLPSMKRAPSLAKHSTINISSLESFHLRTPIFCLQMSSSPHHNIQFCQRRQQGTRSQTACLHLHDCALLRIIVVTTKIVQRPYTNTFHSILRQEQSYLADLWVSCDWEIAFLSLYLCFQQSAIGFRLYCSLEKLQHETQKIWAFP